jgi:hypothetical protein
LNVNRETARRWVLDEDRNDADIGHLILVSFDEGPARDEMWEHVNEARREARQARPDGMTDYARRKIPEILETRRTLRRATRQQVYKVTAVDPGTQRAWEKKGWLDQA